MSLLADSLRRFECRQSSDQVKTDLELTCTECGTVVADIEHGDNLKILAEVADEHVCDEDGAPCCPDPGCTGKPCTFPGYADNH